MSKDSDIIEQVAELLEDAYIFIQGEEHPIPDSTIQQIDQLYRKHYRERLGKIIDRSTMIRELGDEYMPVFSVSVQYFDLSSIRFDDKDDAEFICTMFRRALKSLIKQELSDE